VTGLTGAADGNNGNDDDNVINSELLQPPASQRQLFSEPEQRKRQKLALKNLITGQIIEYGNRQITPTLL
jgi:hypothetical protein